jgi:Ca2+-binding EF-hand superfamily protein
MRLPSIFAMALAIGGAAASIAAAQPGQERREARQRPMQMDTNGDGAVSRQEWRGTAASFRVHDWNRDGMLSGRELRELARQTAGDELDDFDGTDNFNDWSEARFTALDRNRDGRLTRSEWYFDADSFLRADRNRDNTLTRAEFLGGDFDDDRGDRFDYLDADGNNRVTRAEWHASDDAFTWLDRNGDGVLTRQEVEGEPSASPSDLFSRIDANKDNRVSPAEWGWSRGSFDDRDTNDDGYLSRREVAALEQVNTTGTDRTTVTVGGTTRWVDTGVVVYAGDRVRFRATGRVQLSSNAADVADAGGANRRAADAPLPNQPAGALLARVDQGAPIFVGESTAQLEMWQSGRLYLSVNDDHLDDNRGEFQVEIQVQRDSTR